jgi:hypothetical protein
MTTTVSNPKMWLDHLEKALATPGETVILATLESDGSMVLQTACTRPMDMVLAARSLLEMALDRTRDDLNAEDGDSQGDDPREQLLSTLDEVLGLLPDPNKDD